MEYISGKLGISQGEVSKILRGERESYTKYIYQFSQILNEPYHELVKNDEVNIYNYGEVREQSQGIVNNLHLNNGEKHLYEQCLKDKENIIQLEREQKLQEREQKEYWKAKYYKMKEKTSAVEAERTKDKTN